MICSSADWCTRFALPRHSSFVPDPALSAPIVAMIAPAMNSAAGQPVAGSFALIPKRPIAFDNCLSFRSQAN